MQRGKNAECLISVFEFVSSTSNRLGTIIVQDNSGTIIDLLDNLRRVRGVLTVPTLFTFGKLLVLSSDARQRCFRLILAGGGSCDLCGSWRPGDVGVASVGRMSTRACYDARHEPPQLTETHMPMTIITHTDKEVTALTSTDVGRQAASCWLRSVTND